MDLPPDRHLAGADHRSFRARGNRRQRRDPPPHSLVDFRCVQAARPTNYFLIFLAAPLVYALTQIEHAPAAVTILAALLLAWVLRALSFLRRRRQGDVPRAVVSLIAGIAPGSTLSSLPRRGPYWPAWSPSYASSPRF